jgi:hypothetical protein
MAGRVSFPNTEAYAAAKDGLIASRACYAPTTALAASAARL